MIVDLYDAIDRMLWAIVAWIAVAAAVGTVVLLAGLACGTWAAKRAWRVFGPHARRGRCAPAGAPEPPSRASRDAEPPPTALREVLSASALQTRPNRSNP